MGRVIHRSSVSAQILWQGGRVSEFAKGVVLDLLERVVSEGMGSKSFAGCAIWTVGAAS